MSKQQKKPPALKRKHPALQNMKYQNFSILVDQFALLDPDPDFESVNGSTDLIESGSNPIRIRNTDQHGTVPVHQLSRCKDRYQVSIQLYSHLRASARSSPRTWWSEFPEIFRILSVEEFPETISNNASKKKRKYAYCENW